MNTVLLKLLGVMAAALVASSCEKNPGNEPQTPSQGENEGGEIVTERPEELVTDSFTAYPSGLNACVDSYLTLEFVSSPSLGTEGAIRIIDSEGSVADEILMEDVAALAQGKPQMTATTVFTTAMDAVGSAASGYYRIVYFNPVTIKDNTVTIRLHSDKLDYGETYSVEIPETAIIADGFYGVSGDEWTFTVMPMPEKDVQVSVGSRDCDFMTVQGAINFANACGQSHEMTISVSDGIYEEHLYIRNKNKLTIKGESRENTIIRADNCNDYINGVGSGTASVPEIGQQVGKAGGRSVILVEGCDMLRFENLSVENTHGHGSQAEAVYFNSDDGRLVVVGCNFTSEQDTLELKGWCLFRNSRITGDVDFIWGYVQAALFEACEIRSCENANGGYIVQARCGYNSTGFVFLDCDLTSEAGVEPGSVYLARSGGSADYYDNVTYVNCRMGDHIARSGWYSRPAPNPGQATALNGWKEYGSTDASGSALDVSSRHSGSLQLETSDCESLYMDAEAVFTDCPRGTTWAL